MSFSLAIAPTSVIDGENSIITASVRTRMSALGTKGYVIAEETIFEKFETHCAKAFSRKQVERKIFSGTECTLIETKKLARGIEKDAYIIGMGGGKALDTAKAVASLVGVPVVTIPTSAATCAAASALSAMYHPTGVASHYLVYTRCPDLMIIDHVLIATSTPTMLAAGMADALAKYFEAFASTQGKPQNRYECIALDIALRIHDTIFSIGKQAFEDMKRGIVSHAFKEIVRTNIALAGLVGGIGGEGCRACAAHAVHNAFTHIPNCTHRFLHGELVAFGNIVQLLLQKKSSDVKKLEQLYHSLNLPSRLSDFDISLSDKTSDMLVKYICSPHDTLKNMPNTITASDVRTVLKQLQ